MIQPPSWQDIKKKVNNFSGIQAVGLRTGARGAWNQVDLEVSGVFATYDELKLI